MIPRILTMIIVRSQWGRYNLPRYNCMISLDNTTIAIILFCLCLSPAFWAVTLCWWHPWYLSLGNRSVEHVPTLWIEACLHLSSYFCIAFPSLILVCWIPTSMCCTDFPYHEPLCTSCQNAPDSSLECLPYHQSIKNIKRMGLSERRVQAPQKSHGLPSGNQTWPAGKSTTSGCFSQL